MRTAWRCVLAIAPMLSLAWPTGTALATPAVNAAASGADSTANAADRDLTVNDIDDIREALSPLVRKELDRAFPDKDVQVEVLRRIILEAQGLLLEGQATIHAGQRKTHRQLDLLVAAALSKIPALEAQIEEWTRRYEELATSMRAPGMEDAKRLLDAGDLDGAEKAMLKTAEKQEQALAEQKRSAADTRYVLGNINYLQFDFDKAGHHFRAAIRKYRDLRDAGNSEVEPDLAKALVYIGLTYGELGRLEEALRASQVAAYVYRGLAKQRPEAFRPDLAMALNNLGAHLSALGQLEDAIKATQEAVDIRRQLAKQRHALYTPALERSLNLLNLLQKTLPEPDISE